MCNINHAAGRVRASLSAVVLASGAVGLLACQAGPPAGPGAPLAPGGPDAAGTITATTGITTTDGLTATSPVSYTEADLITGTRQLILEGSRSGEGYFSPDGTEMIFQSEREPGNPFYQQYLLDLETGDLQMLSTGEGKTTCGWIHPDGAKILFAATHEDPAAVEKQQALLELRAAGKAPRNAFEFDDAYEIYEMVPGSTEFTNLTRAPGYDAEGSWSSDGSLIVFASNRLAYADPDGMSDEDRERFEADPSYMGDIYVMDADGSNVRRLTDHQGYDGGPFFSPDGKRIVWRSFNAEGDKAEIWTMNADGSDKRQITRLGAMSWAPYYHPTGEYIIFTTNLHGFGNFELYMVDVDGAKEPLRVTFTDGPDVLPVFTPDGDRLSWVNRRGGDGRAQIHIADWNDAKARELLVLAPGQGEVAYGVTAGDAVAADLASTAPEIRAADARLHVERLASEALAGRLTGTPGEALATMYVADAFERIGLAPDGDDGYFEPFEFTKGVSMRGTNMLSVKDAQGADSEATVDDEWRPLSFSKTGSVGHVDVVFAGYGLVAPADGEEEAYDSYGDLDVTDKWVLALRYLPEDVTPERRQHLSRYSTLRYKAMEARDRGAAGLIVVTGPSAGATEELVPLEFDGTVAGAAIPALSVTDALADGWLAGAEHGLAMVQSQLDAGEVLPGFVVTGTQVGAHIDLTFDEGTGRNVVGRLQVGEGPSAESVVIGAHVDHLGHGEMGNSLATAEEEGQIHYGADDNASGVAGLIEIAQFLTDAKSNGKLADARRDIVFGAWSGEELGLLGSSHHVDALAGDGDDAVYPEVAAYLNMDMIGRGDKGVILQGIASSPFWKGEIEKRNVVVGLPLELSDNAYLPSDATSFYVKGVPVLNAFTNVHAEYHTPRDTADDLNYDVLASTARLMALVAQTVASQEAPPEYVKVAGSADADNRRVGRVYLGTVPDMTAMAEITGGVLLSGVSGKSPAEAAGLQGGDVVVELAGQKLDNIYDYMKVLDALKIGEPVTIIVLRGGERVVMSITPTSRE